MKKEILKETREPGKSRKKKGQPKGWRNGFLEGLTGKDFTAAGLFFFSLLLCRLFVLQYGVFGSSIDWISQHSTLADYFRKRFYATGNLFPDFAWNLGGGQNIYHFAYYGLLSPTMLLSYLFPFIPMDLWVMGSSALLYAADAVLFYRWISKKGLHYGNCLFTSLFFTCSTALLYHSYNQLMFVNYMPFLLLALLGVDRHFQKRKSGLLILSVLGMILTSFYFSVGGLLALTAYAETEYFKYYVGNASDAAKEKKRNEPREKNRKKKKNQKACEKAAGYSETAMAPGSTQTNRLTGINHTYANENTEFHYLVTMREDGTASLRLGKGHLYIEKSGAWTGWRSRWKGGTAVSAETYVNWREQQRHTAVTASLGCSFRGEKTDISSPAFHTMKIFVLRKWTDGKQTCSRVNTSFLGARIPAGEHRSFSIPCAGTDGRNFVRLLGFCWHWRL